MHHPSYRSLGFLLLIIFAINLFTIPLFCHFQPAIHSSIYQPEVEAQQAIDDAQTAINEAYLLLTIADSIGVEINDIISTLNGAINTLNQARSAFNASDYTTAMTLANTAQNTAEGVGTQAAQRYDATRVQLIIQIIIILAVVVIVIVVTYFAIRRWRTYRKQKRQEFLQMEIRLPEENKESKTSE